MPRRHGSPGSGMTPFYPASSSTLSPGQKGAESKQAIFDPAPMVFVSVYGLVLATVES